MLIELHIIQNFAPSNLNRDETGSPKDCDFGGVRRARISSQCIKRSIRDMFKVKDLISPQEMGNRTKNFLKKVVDELAKQKPREDAQRVAEAALKGVKLKVKSDGKTEYLIFLAHSAIEKISTLCLDNWEVLKSAMADKDEKAAARKRKKPGDLSKKIIDILDGARASDIALFGRMVADLPDINVDAASQVAHAISTHKVIMDFDFYTAVEDLPLEEETGAAMMGTVEFNSACFYRYSNVNVDELNKNLDYDEDLSRKTIKAFLRASVAAIPTGKQNSFAALNPPDFVLVIVREDASPVSLANAFEKPVTIRSNKGLVEESIKALDNYWIRFTSAYGDNGIKTKTAIRVTDEPELKGLNLIPVTFENLISNVMDSIEFRKGE